MSWGVWPEVETDPLANDSARDDSLGTRVFGSS